MQRLGTRDAAAALSPAPSHLTCSLRGVSETWAPGSVELLAFPAKKGRKQQNTCASEQNSRLVAAEGRRVGQPCHHPWLGAVPTLAGREGELSEEPQQGFGGLVPRLAE